MFNAPFLKRIATTLAACGLALLLAPAAHSQVIDLSLNVFYDMPSDVNSGGRWELVAKSTDSIATLNVKLTGINAGVVNEAPRGVVNGNQPAGFAQLDFVNGAYLIWQEPVFPTGDLVEGAFYGVGTQPNGEPGDVGPAFPPGTLTNLQDVPWATGDSLVDVPSVWDVATMFLSGSFADNFTPAFGLGSSGSVFSSVGTSIAFGPTTNATINPLVRTNFNPNALSPDYNIDGIVDAADYIVWRKGLPQADGDGDGLFNSDPDDYGIWRRHFAEIVPLPGGSNPQSAAVPEPATAILLFSTIICAAFPRPNRD